MNLSPLDFWNDRYGAAEYAYGTSPNGFFQNQLDELKPGTLLLPAEGEGRNALYAAKRGWNVMAFDISSSGRNKAMKQALEQNVKFKYQVSDVLEFKTDKQFDALGLVYAHFPRLIRKRAHQRLLEIVKPGGKVIFEAFAKEQLENTSGGPKSSEMLFSIEEIKDEFSQLQFELLEQKSIQLKEGRFHQGKAEVLRFVGTKV